MKGTLGIIAFAAWAATCTAVCHSGSSDRFGPNVLQCTGLSSSVIEPTKNKPLSIDISNSTIATIKAFSFSWAGDVLKELNITGCGVETLEQDAFGGLSQLELLNLANNRIRKIDATWINGMPNLDTLLLWRNRINEIDPKVYGLLPKLREWDIAYNELQECLSENTLRQLTKLRKIFIAGNPWRYRCRPPMTWYLGSNHILFIADWGAKDRLIDDCRAHEPHAEYDDAALEECVDRKDGSAIVRHLEMQVNEMTKKLDKLEATIQELKKSKA